ncbi:MAG: hypothetical protein IH950_11100 [Bacteroidetes bacterium]|nr:hypothetical protein [Bacteroidota bacterium]
MNLEFYRNVGFLEKEHLRQMCFLLVQPLARTHSPNLYELLMIIQIAIRFFPG